jgi:hypothetical protein
MIERQQELKRRYHRKAKMRKLKAKLIAATGADREKLLYKIKRLSPWWTEASLTQKAQTAASPSSGEKKERPASKPKSDRPGGPPRQKAEKK